MAMKKGLGKGVGALLGESALTMQTDGGDGVKLLPLQKVEPNPAQPRKYFDPEELQTLADSIAMHGVIQPLTVRQLPSGFYQIIAGERRWRASRLAGLTEVPVVVIEADDKKAMELALIENLQRADLNPIDILLKSCAQQIADHRHQRLKAAEPYAADRGVAEAEALHGKALADRNGKCIHRKPDGQKKQFDKTHNISPKIKIRSRRRAPLRSKPDAHTADRHL